MGRATIAVVSRTRATDSAFIAAPPERLFTVLLAVGRYATWWPPTLAPRIVSEAHLGAGSIIEAGPRFGRFQTRISEAEPPRRLSVAYVGGSPCGPRDWSGSMERQTGTHAELRASEPEDETVSRPPPHRALYPMRPSMTYKDEEAQDDAIFYSRAR